MAQIYKNIKFNGYDLFSKFGLMSIHVNQNEERIFGLKRTMEMQEGVDNPIFIKNKGDKPSFQVELCKIRNGEPVGILDSELEEAGKILFSDSVGTLEAGGDLYYGVFVGGGSWFNGASQGWLNLTFEMSVPHCYSAIYIDTIKVIGDKTVEVFNKSSVKDNLYVDMEFQQLGEDGEVIEIINKTNGNKMKFKNINKNEVIKVVGESIKEVFSETNPSKNVYKDTEYNDFINIRYGKNIIEIKGKCKINIRYQLPRILK